MSAVEQDLVKLYSKRILALAANMPHVGRLEAPGGSAWKRSPLCGSTVTVDLVLGADGRVTAFAQDVKACALGQASAAILGAGVIGSARAEIEAGRAALTAMLKEGADAPDGRFAELEVLSPARDYKNRHASILLAWDATLAAMDEAG